MEIGDTDTDSEMKSSYKAKDKCGIHCLLFLVIAGNSIVAGTPRLAVYSSAISC